MALETYCGAMEYVSLHLPSPPPPGLLQLSNNIQLVLAKPCLLVEDLEHAPTEKTRAFGFLYCNYKERAEQTFQNLISSLTRQLIHHTRTIPSELRRLHQRYLDIQIRPSRQELLGLLTTVGSKFSSLYIVIDALDECDEIEEVRSCLFSTLRETLPRACFLVTSRSVPEIEVQFENHPRLKIKATDEDIRRYVSDQILRKPTLKRHIKADPNLRISMIETICLKSDGMFLLVTLHTASLATKPTRNALRRALENLPTELDNTYNEALQRIRNQKEEFASLAEEVLMWVLLAVEPLKIIELQHAIASISLDGQTDTGDEDLTDPETLLDVCARHWGKHARDVPEDDCRAQILGLISQQYVRVITNVFSDCYTPKTQDMRTLANLAYAAAFGLTSYVNDLLNEGVHVNQTNQLGTTALMSAAGAGYIDTVRALLDAGADVNKADHQGSTALVSAAYARDEDIVRVLLAAGAQPDPVNGLVSDESSALRTAARRGHAGIVQILLDHGANIEATPKNSENTSLIFAARWGSTAMAQLLIDKGANICAWEGGLPDAAIQSRSTAMVELAIGLMKGSHMENPLLYMMLQWLRGGGIIAAIFELLIEKGTNLTGAIDGVTPIHVAARYGNVEAVRSLLKHGVSPNIRDGDGNTPIHGAALSGEHEMIEILVDHGTDPTAQNDAGESGPHAFLRSEYPNYWMPPLVPLLVRCGVPVNAPDAEGKTALHIAAHRGLDSPVEFLMEHGADSSRKDHKGFTPLETAGIAGNEKLVEQMLEHLAIPCSPHLTRLLVGSRLRNAVKKKDSVLIQEILKDPDLDVSLPDGFGTTALHFAASYGQKNIVESLLKRGAL
ncbi:MAG: hypothetical protein Q9198_003528, partial [Flavoplaca austrocitrina]